MLSGIGPADHLRDHGLRVVLDLPGVGRNLVEHFGCVMRWACTQPVSLLTAASLPNLLRFLVLGRGPLTSNVAEAAAFVRSRAGLDAPDVEIMFGAALFEGAGLVEPTRHGFSLAPIVLQPRSRGRITLRSANPLDAPSIQPSFLSDSDGEDRRTLLAAMRIARRIAECPALAPYRGQELAPGPGASDEGFVRAEGHTNWHPAGTCRMGVDALAVVDPALRVHGIAGLRVADASVMPQLNRGHPNAPVVMIGERAADLLRGAVATECRGMAGTDPREAGPAASGVAAPTRPDGMCAS
jgi:choline dehydrogenase